MKTVKEISELLSVNPETVRRWIRDGKLNARKESKKEGFLVTETDFEDFVKRKKTVRKAYNPNIFDSTAALVISVREYVKIMDSLKEEAWKQPEATSAK